MNPATRALDMALDPCGGSLYDNGLDDTCHTVRSNDDTSKATYRKRCRETGDLDREENIQDGRFMRIKRRLREPFSELKDSHSISRAMFQGALIDDVDSRPAYYPQIDHGLGSTRPLNGMSSLDPPHPPFEALTLSRPKSPRSAVIPVPLSLEDTDQHADRVHCVQADQGMLDIGENNLHRESILLTRHPNEVDDAKVCAQSWTSGISDPFTIDIMDENEHHLHPKSHQLDGPLLMQLDDINNEAHSCLLDGRDFTAIPTMSSMTDGDMQDLNSFLAGLQIGRSEDPWSAERVARPTPTFDLSDSPLNSHQIPQSLEMKAESCLLGADDEAQSKHSGATIQLVQRPVLDSSATAPFTIRSDRSASASNCSIVVCDPNDSEAYDRA